MRKLLFTMLIAVSSFAFSGSSGAAPPSPFTDSQKADLDRVSAALNAVKTMSGRFTQIDGSGNLSNGYFMIRKPGKMRFAYYPPMQTLVVSDGYSISVQNQKLHTTDRYPLIGSPLTFVLSDDLDLKKNEYVTGIEHQNGAVIVRAHANTRAMQGDITMVFSDPGLELRQWTIIDAQGQQTTVSLSEVKTGMPLPGSTFLLGAQNSFTKNKQD
jgi:outer membrane lipoprotein-sorting protein